MQPVIPPGDPARTVIAGKAQGYIGLAVNYAQTSCGQPLMRIAWQPTPTELVAINGGAPIIIEMLGRPPILPMVVGVGEVPE